MHDVLKRILARKQEEVAERRERVHRVRGAPADDLGVGHHEGRVAGDRQPDHRETVGRVALTATERKPT